MKKKIFFSILLTCLFFGLPAFAILTVPTGSPLQPIPQNTGPSYNQNVNSEESVYSKNQKLQQEQISQPSPVPALDANEAQTNPVAVPDNNSIAPSTEPIGLYWAMLIVGSLGLIGAIIWMYWRFRKYS